MSAAQSVAERPAAPGGASGGGARRNLGIALVVIATAQLMVVLDATIVNVALPHIQRALGFSGTGLEWMITAYAVSFGGLLLLGGRAGDLLGRRRVFIAGLLLFSAASLVGGFATSQAWLLTARAVQGIGGAMIAPTALALITTTFAEGRARNRAMGVYAAMSGGGAAVGLVAGGLLTTYLSWRWVLFVNVPIGILVAAAAPLVLGESARRRGRFDLPGAIAGTAGVALLVYGLANAATDQAGVSHWTDTKVVASLAAAVALLVTFVVIERRSRHALMPLRIFASRSRSGAYLIMLMLATAMFGIFFFLTIFVQDVLGYNALTAGVAFLPYAGTIVVVSVIASRLVARTGARPLMLAGAAVTAGGMYWFSRIGVHTTYLGGLLGPMLVTAAGLGLLFVPLQLVALARVGDEDSGLASSLLGTGQQVGGAIGLAALGTVAWTAVASSLRSQMAHAAAAAGRPGHALAGARVPAPVYHQALAGGITRGFLAAAGIALAALVITVIAIRVRREDLTGTAAAAAAEGQPAGAGHQCSQHIRNGCSRAEAASDDTTPSSLSSSHGQCAALPEGERDERQQDRPDDRRDDHRLRRVQGRHAHRLSAGRAGPGRGGAARQQRVGPQPHPARTGADRRVQRLPARPARPRPVRPAPPGPQHAHRDGGPASCRGRIRRAEGVRGQRQRADRPASRPHRPGDPPGRRLRAGSADGHLRQVHRMGAPLRPGDGPRPGGGRSDHQHVRV
jgi:EmrB/QacA subfamily drug resistance transporter